MHPLEKYLKNRDETQKEFAERIGISVEALANYIKGRRQPLLSIALKIQEATKGKVSVQELNDYWNHNG